MAKDLNIVNAVAKIILPSGHPVLVQVNEGAYLGHGQSLLSKNQVGAFRIHVDDDPYIGVCVIKTQEQLGQEISLTFENGLTHMRITKPTAFDVVNLKIIVLASVELWNPNLVQRPSQAKQVAQGAVKTREVPKIKHRWSN